MLKAYVDTNVIIARYKPGDPLYESANGLLELPDTKFYISPLTLVELYSVLSRVRIETSVRALTLHPLIIFIMKDCRLILASRSYTLKSAIAGHEFRQPIEYHLAAKLAEQLKLRALDLLHVAHAALLRKAELIDILITGDEEIIERRDQILESTGVFIKHPDEITKAS